jgi:cytochrome bd ubiquinol oxidase subunit I
MDVEILARIQFALTVGFHYIYPPLSIGLGLFLVFIEATYLKTKNERYREMARFWTRIFALTFAMGVATGLVQVFEFGTNWAAYSRYVGDVFGSALGAEGIFAFLLESGFLALLLFGWDRVGPKTHFFSTVMVAVGAHFSAVWIVVANSWMQTPAGFHIVGEGLAARAEITSFWEMVFNPSSMERLAHVLIGCWLAGAFLVVSISAYYLLRNRHVQFARTSLKVSLVMATVCLVLQTISGDQAARTVVEHQPAKLAAMEGLFETQESAPFSLLGFPNMEKRETEGIKIPGLLSILSYHKIGAKVTGLDAFPEDLWPPVRAVFATYRIMLGMWGLMLLTVVLGWIFWKKLKKGRRRWVLWLMIFSIGFPMLANEAGWFTAEMGRQPWVVYNLLRTSEGLSAVVSAGQVMGSIIMFLVLYVTMLALFLYLLDRKIKHGPEAVPESAPHEPPTHQHRAEA